MNKAQAQALLDDLLPSDFEEGAPGLTYQNARDILKAYIASIEREERLRANRSRASELLTALHNCRLADLGAHPHPSSYVEKLQRELRAMVEGFVGDDFETLTDLATLKENARHDG